MIISILLILFSVPLFCFGLFGLRRHAAQRQKKWEEHLAKGTPWP